ncbi:hypothetical protein ACFL31_02255 [Candidatus Margulisiibacteriota bacterium]
MTASLGVAHPTTILRPGFIDVFFRGEIDGVPTEKWMARMPKPKKSPGDILIMCTVQSPQRGQVNSGERYEFSVVLEPKADPDAEHPTIIGQTQSREFAMSIFRDMEDRHETVPEDFLRCYRDEALDKSTYENIAQRDRIPSDQANFEIAPA